MNFIKISQKREMQKRSFGVQLTNININDKNKSLATKTRASNSLYNKKAIKKQKVSMQNQPAFIFQTSTQMDIQEIPISSSPRQATQQYQSNILTHLINIEKKKSTVNNYFIYQKDITENMRGILLSWLVDVHMKYKLLPQTLFITINIIDQYLEKQAIQRNQLQLLGITALWISAKFEQTYQVPKVSNLQYICDGTYNKKQIFDMEGKILQALEFNLLNVNCFTFLQIFSKFAKLQQKDYFLARYLIEIAKLDFSMIKYKPSYIAAASIYFIKKIRKYPCWVQVLELNSDYSQLEIRKCARDLCNLLQKADQSQHFQSLKKKFCGSQYLQVGKIRIGQKAKQ